MSYADYRTRSKLGLQGVLNSVIQTLITARRVYKCTPMMTNKLENSHGARRFIEEQELGVTEASAREAKQLTLAK